MTAHKANKAARPKAEIGGRGRNLLKHQPAPNMSRDWDDARNGVDAALLDNAARAEVVPAIGAVAGKPFAHAAALPASWVRAGRVSQPSVIVPGAGVASPRRSTTAKMAHFISMRPSL